MRRVAQFGEVMEHHLGKGNWLFVRYASALQAEKARAQNGELCSMCVGGETHQAVVGVSRVTHETAERLGLIGLLSALAADGGPSAGGAATADFDDAAHAASQLQWGHNDRGSKVSKFGRGELSRCNVAYDDLLLQPRPVFWYHNLFKWLVQTLTDFFLS